jgi:hypothetical protein
MLLNLIVSEPAITNTFFIQAELAGNSHDLEQAALAGLGLTEALARMRGDHQAQLAEAAHATGLLRPRKANNFD